MAIPDNIIDASKELRAIDANAPDCNRFVIAVADKLGVALNGTADQMIAETSESGWTQHGKDGQAAREAAKAGALVIGGTTSQDLGQRSWTSRYRS